MIKVHVRSGFDGVKSAQYTDDKVIAPIVNSG